MTSKCAFYRAAFAHFHMTRRRCDATELPMFNTGWLERKHSSSFPHMCIRRSDPIDEVGTDWDEMFIWRSRRRRRRLSRTTQFDDPHFRWLLGSWRRRSLEWVIKSASRFHSFLRYLRVFLFCWNVINRPWLWLPNVSNELASSVIWCLTLWNILKFVDSSAAARLFDSKTFSLSTEFNLVFFFCCSFLLFQITLATTTTLAVYIKTARKLEANPKQLQCINQCACRTNKH